MYDARSDTAAAGEFVVSDDPSLDPRIQLPAAIDAATRDDLDAALRGIVETAAEALRPTWAAIFLADPDRDGLQLAASVGLDDRRIAELVETAQASDRPWSTVAASRAPLFDVAEAGYDGGGDSATFVPLVVRGGGGTETGLGVLGIARPAGDATSDAERSFVGALASLAAIAADRTRHASTATERSEWFERMAHTDPLTGIANERTVTRVLELELARAGRQGSEVSLALFDIDDFRSANASDGHRAGDDILRRVASVLSESVRLVDTVGRIGGDEFVLVAPGSAGSIVAKRVQDGITALPAVAGRRVSVSAGVATFPRDGSDVDALISAATQALARAKAAGSGSVAATGPRVAD